MKRGLVVLFCTVLFWLSQVSASWACAAHFYEPEVPETLRKQA